MFGVFSLRLNIDIDKCNKINQLEGIFFIMLNSVFKGILRYLLIHYLILINQMEVI